MTAQHDSQIHWLDIFPFSQQLCPNLTPSTPRFVDIGGSIGRQCQALKSRFPKPRGRLISQDQAPVLAQALPTVVESVELMAYDFSTP
jgi:demethylsterigmatocystin 6-O-methyltransferase